MTRTRRSGLFRILLMGLTFFFLLIACSKSEPDALSENGGWQKSHWVDSETELMRFIDGRVTFRGLKNFEVPEIVRQRQEKDGHLARGKAHFVVKQSQLHIDLNQKKMKLSIEVESEGVRENLDLSGSLDSDEFRLAGDLYQVDGRQDYRARALCEIDLEDSHRCDFVVTNIYRRLDGRDEYVQIRSRVQEATVATSGDGEDDSVDEESAKGDLEPRPTPKQEAPLPLPTARPIALDSLPAEVLETLPIQYAEEVMMGTPPVVRQQSRDARPIVKQHPPRTDTGAVMTQSRNFHDDGRLNRAEFIPLKDENFERKRPTGWTSIRMKDYLMSMVSEFLKLRPGGLFLIGHLSAQRGGRLAGQSSHQNGLDGDFYYLSRSTARPTSNLSAIGQGGRLNPDFDVERTYDLMLSTYRLHKDSLMGIYVNYRVKRAFCELSRGRGEALGDPQSDAYQLLRHLIPSYSISRGTLDLGHGRHFHVRLNCPEAEKPECKDTIISLPQTNGCQI